jgi:hypothetical protein
MRHDMKSIIKARFKAIDYYTMRRISFTKMINADNQCFEDTKTKPITINNGSLTLMPVTIFAKDKAADWIGEQSSFLDSLIHNPARELNCILDWEILSIKNINDKGEETSPIKIEVTEQPKDKMELVLSMVTGSEPMSEEFKNDFLHTYKEMEASMKGLSTEKKISLTLSAMGVGMKAAGTAYNHMTNILSGKKERKQITN